MTLAHSNLQSLVPKTNALSIRPQGHLQERGTLQLSAAWTSHVQNQRHASGHALACRAESAAGVGVARAGMTKNLALESLLWDAGTVKMWPLKHSSPRVFYAMGGDPGKWWRRVSPRGASVQRSPACDGMVQPPSTRSRAHAPLVAARTRCVLGVQSASRHAAATGVLHRWLHVQYGPSAQASFTV